MAQLYGSCACERNQYTIIVPANLTSRAQVFFDNSTTSRRAQATPLTAWLRIPLDWYHSTTYALFPDESHSTIKRTFHIPSSLHDASLPPIRRQFCGYCGTHLTAWSEADRDAKDWLDVTLGSLMGESLEKLERVGILSEEEYEEYEDEKEPGSEYARGNEYAPQQTPQNEYADEMVKSATIDDEVHIPANDGMSGQEGPGAVAAVPSTTAPYPPQRMQNRGMPYFEQMVENSRLGRIRRQKGGHTSQDGRTTVQWEVVEIDNSDPLPDEAGLDAGERGKRRRMGS